MGVLWITMFSITNKTEQLLHIIKTLQCPFKALAQLQNVLIPWSFILTKHLSYDVFALVQWKENGQKRKPRNTNYIRFSIDIFLHIDFFYIDKLFMYCIYTLSLKL